MDPLQKFSLELCNFNLFKITGLAISLVILGSRVTNQRLHQDSLGRGRRLVELAKLR